MELTSPVSATDQQSAAAVSGEHTSFTCTQLSDQHFSACYITAPSPEAVEQRSSVRVGTEVVQERRSTRPHIQPQFYSVECLYH